MTCIECGGAVSPGSEQCEDCKHGRLTGNLTLQSAVDMIRCNRCEGQILPSQLTGTRLCSNCNKRTHIACDSSEHGIGFVCITCRQSPLVGDVMFSAPHSPFAHVSRALNPHEVLAGPSMVLSGIPAMQHALSNAVAAVGADIAAMGDFSEIYQQLAEEINSPATTSDSNRNSPSFYPENSPSDVDDDFVPGRVPGIRGRGGAKKKPPRGASFLKIRSSTIPATGMFTAEQLAAITSATTRGKRGKRGSSTKGPGKGTGRGRGRGRGSSLQMTQSMTMQQILMHQQPSQNVIREVDESLIDEEPRHHSSRSDDEYVRTIVVCDSSDPFLQKACLCLVCGAVGKGPENSMVACSNCAQTFHTYCVGLHDKLNATLVFRGWRCLDCTVCEGCGEGKDESKLLLCEECDVSYHIYCLKPPLEKIPSGPWRCQWCARCRRCGSKVDSGTDLTREGLCIPCHSLRKCPKCVKFYNIGDKIIRCSACSRWYHGTCEGLFSDEMLEQAAANKLRCSNCRPSRGSMHHMLGDNSNVVLCDNVALNKAAEEVLKSKFMPSLCRPNAMEYGHRDSFDHYDDFNEDFEYPGSSRGRGGGGRGGGPGRRIAKLGIGGFYVKIPRHRMLAFVEEAAASNAGEEDDVKRMKRPRKPRRSQLEDAYPPAIQEGFFGIKAVEGKTLVDLAIEEPLLAEYGNGRTSQHEGTGHELSTEATEMLRNDMNEVDILDSLDLHDVEGEIDKMDLSLFCMDEEDEDDFDDSLNDAMDLMQKDGFDPSAEVDLNDIKPTVDVFGSTTFPLEHALSSNTPGTSGTNPEGPGFNGTPAQHIQLQNVQQAGMRNNALSRSSSQNEQPERINATIERWEEDEPLGDKATTAAVLYANEKHANLKEQYPEWTDRVRQIQRLWRVLSAEERQEYVNRARENRTSRGKQPRPRKVQGSQSVDSPTVQSPGPSFFPQRPGMAPDDRFKVPAAPADAPQPPQETVRVVSHLTPELQLQYKQIGDRQADLEKIAFAMENDLNKQRKQKKNLAAKKRQMIKTATTAPDYDGRLIELNEADKLQFQQLTESIPVLQKELENSKRDMKAHEAVLREFENKHNILRPASEVQLLQPLMPPPQGPIDPARMQMMRQQMMVPSHHPQMMQQRLQPGAPPMQMRVPQQMPYGMMIHNPQDVHRQMQMQRARAGRSAVLGNIPYERIQNVLEREVYECLDDVIHNLCMRIDGKDEARENMGMLKRLLDPGMMASPHGGGAMEPMDGGPRPKKKRTQPKKLIQNIVAGSEYEAWVEKMRTRFRLCQEIPKRAKEPGFRNPGPAFATMGITDLRVRPDRKPLSGNGFGEMHLSYTDDYYSGEDRSSRVLAYNLTSMVDIAPQINLVALQNVAFPPQPEYIYDEFDAKMASSTALNVLSTMLERTPPLEHIRTHSKISESGPPMEPHRRIFYQEPKKEEIEVSVVLKEDPEAPDRGVKEMLDKLRGILGVSKNIDYTVDSPPLSPSNIKQEVEEDVKASTSKGTPSSSTPRCKFCSKAVDPGQPPIRQKLSRLGIAQGDSEEDETASFCTMRCYYQLMATSKMPLSNDELVAAEGHVDEETLAKLRQINAENFAKTINQGKRMSVAPALHMDGMLSPRDTRYMMDEGRKEHVTIINVSELAAAQETAAKNEAPKAPVEDWKAYSKEIAQSFIKMQNVQQEFVQSAKMGVPTPPYELDQRRCVLCGGQGDGETSVCGRLLNLTDNVWVHVNCAIWSTEVFENPSGALVHVDRAVIRASKQQCCFCGRNGASLKCHKVDCNMNFHLTCAKNIGGYFVRDRTFICRSHDGVAPEVTVQKLDALRRIYIQRDENILLARLVEVSDGPKLCLRLGAFSFFKIGQILPEQLKAFHNSNFIYPCGYGITRWFWSPLDPRVRILFECTIREVEQQPQFVVRAVGSEVLFTGATATEAWKPVLEGVQNTRSQMDVLRFFAKAVQGETLYGLNESAITKITESLPGVDSLFTYTFRHPNSPMLDLPLAENPMGCARAEPRFRTLIKSSKQKLHEFNFTRPAHAAQSSGRTSLSEGRTRNQRGSFADEQAAAQLRAVLGLSSEQAALWVRGLEPIQSNQQNFSSYQKMRKEWRQTVYLARSKIAGLGLYAKRDISMGDFIIEYKGELIRSEVGEMRERRYTREGRGVYMFRVDDDLIIDATMAGGPARYINHSCDPNCSTRILEAGSSTEDKKIIITANRPIKAYEELTYDYQFELEDTTDKLPCLCGAPNCVKWMN